MSQMLRAVFENGAFRPLEPVSCQEREEVFLTIEPIEAVQEDLLDHEFLAYCDTQADDSISLQQVREAMAKIPGSMADAVRAERDEK